jgi:DNA-binding winged helix-turn-helix (wHTH) protein
MEGFEVLLTCPKFSLGFSFGGGTPAQAGTNRMTYLFEDYALDTERRELRRGADLVSVEPQVFDLLLFLIRNRTRVVSRDDLIAEVWNGRIVSESALYSRISGEARSRGPLG